MSTLVGRTFSYPNNGTMVSRKVIGMITRGTKRIYELLDPVSHRHTEAVADIFDRMFKAKSRGPIIRDKKYKGKTIGNKQTQSIYE